MAAAGIQATPAAGQGFFSWFDGDEPRSSSARKWKRHPHSHSRPTAKAHARRGVKAAAAKTAAPDAKTAAPDAKTAEGAGIERPLFLVASIGDQSLAVYNHRGLVARSAISTGMAGHPTPKGVFTIIGRERFHRSNIYSAAPMPFMQRITWSGIAMHLGVVPGHPASHGCIRLPAAFAARLWGLTRIGERVVISPQEATPSEFTHPLLPAPKMRAPTEAASAPPAPESLQAPGATARPPLVNPQEYAQRLKAKAAADAAAAVKAAKEAAAAVGAKKPEVARAAAELEASEAAHVSARAKADAAVRAFETAAAAAGARQQEAALAAAALKSAEADVSGKGKADRLARVSDKAAAARDAAALAKDAGAAALAAAAARLDAAKAAAAAKDAELADAVRRMNEATAAAAAAATAEKEARRRAAPVSVLVSKKDQRIYVRQGLAPLFDAPASVRDPETPIGSHLFIATAANDDGAQLKWSVVSMPARIAEAPGERRKKKAPVEPQGGTPSTPRRSSSTAAEALERVEIAQDVRDRIAERLWTGGSLIIADQPPSGETGNEGTDLTVVLR